MGIERSNVFIFQHEPMLPPRLRRTEKPLQSMVDVASIIEDFVDRSQKRAAGGVNTTGVAQAPFIRPPCTL